MRFKEESDIIARNLPIEIDFSKEVRKLHWALQNRANKVLSPYHITIEHLRLLKIVLDNPGSEQNYLAENSQKVKSTISNIINTMVDNGLIIKVHDRDDARINQIFITKKGQDLLQLGIRDLSKSLQEIFDDKEELEKMTAILKRMNDSL